MLSSSKNSILFFFETKDLSYKLILGVLIIIFVYQSYTELPMSAHWFSCFNITKIISILRLAYNFLLSSAL